MEELQTDRMPRAILVGVERYGVKDFAHSMEELRSLAEACGMETVAIVTQALPEIQKAFYIGPGKVAEVKEAVEQLEADHVIFDNELSPSQQRNLQHELEVMVLDRTNLILQIFESRARTREARLQVETASLQYLLPRLVGMREALSRQGGSGGTGAGRGFSNKGAGEKKLELDRRRITHRISELEKELEMIAKDRRTQRKKRSRSPLPQVALVGYTNAGKSTLMNRLVAVSTGGKEKQVLEKDMLFATLDTTVRRISPGDNRDFLLSDTVGFIDKLPHHLVKAFRSTLEEACQADLLLLVVDYSDPYHKEQLQVTEATLRELGAQNIPKLYLYNKAELVLEQEKLPRLQGDRLFFSAREGIGLEMLLELIADRLFVGYRRWELLVPYEKGAVASELQDTAVVESLEYGPEGIFMTVNSSQAIYEKYRTYENASLTAEGKSGAESIQKEGRTYENDGI